MKELDREKFIRGLNKGKIDPETAFSYFVSKGGKVDYQTFIQILPHFSKQVIDTLLIDFNVVVLEKEGRVIKYM